MIRLASIILALCITSAAGISSMHMIVRRPMRFRAD